MTARLNELAERFFTAVTSGDNNLTASCYDESALVWHNYDGVTQTRVDNLKALRWLARNLENFRYTDVERLFFDNGFVQRHVLRGAFRGTEIQAPACIVAHVKDGLIIQLYEYLDSKHLAPILGT